MLTMQAFHTILISKVDGHSEYFKTLERLTQIDLSQIEAFRSDIAWSIWN